MRNSETVLYNLAIQAEDREYRFEKLIRHLYNPDFYRKAEGNACTHKGARSDGMVKSSTSSCSHAELTRLIESIKTETFEAHSMKTNKRDHLLVQKVIRIILETIYDPIFSDHSHGFRRKRSCHTALREIDSLFTGTKWLIRGNIKGSFSHLNHHSLIQIMQKRIKDQKFLRLIQKFLKSGSLTDWKKACQTYSGTPQGGILSPIFANIYLNELDCFIDEQKKQFDQGTADREVNPEYRKLRAKIVRRRKKYQEHPSPKLSEEIKRIEQQLQQCPYYDSQTERFTRMHYVRYADQFLIGIIGLRSDAEQLKRDICRFLKDELKIEVTDETIQIVHRSKGVRFLGYELNVGANGHIQFNMPKETTMKWLQENQVISFQADGTWRPVARHAWTNLSDLEIISLYNQQLTSIYRYFSMANNIYRQMNTLKYAMEFSCLSTLAKKHKSSVGQVRNKLSQGKRWGVKQLTAKGEKFVGFFHEPITRSHSPK